MKYDNELIIGGEVIRANATKEMQSTIFGQKPAASQSALES